MMPSDNLPFMFAAYAIAWIAFCIYAFFITRRQQELEQEIMVLQKIFRKFGVTRQLNIILENMQDLLTV